MIQYIRVIIILITLANNALYYEQNKHNCWSQQNEQCFIFTRRI